VKSIQSQSQSYVTTDGQSGSLSWCQAPIWGLRSDFYYCQAVTGLLMWGSFSDERTGLTLTIAAGYRPQSFSGPSPGVLVTIFYCLRFDTTPTWKSRCRIYIPRKQGGPVIPLCTGSRFVTCSLHSLKSVPSPIFSYILSARTTHRKQPLYCCVAQTTQKTRVTCQSQSQSYFTTGGLPPISLS
jgi:hypothetical protein